MNLLTHRTVSESSGWGLVVMAEDHLPHLHMQNIRLRAGVYLRIDITARGWDYHCDVHPGWCLPFAGPDNTDLLLPAHVASCGLYRGSRWWEKGSVAFSHDAYAGDAEELLNRYPVDLDRLQSAATMARKTRSGYALWDWLIEHGRLPFVAALLSGEEVDPCKPL